MPLANPAGAGPTPGLAAERRRLVRLCARLTGDPDAAEDLAQEALLEAHRTADRLRDPGRAREWLTGIARNVCRRWRQRRGRDLARRALQGGPDGGWEADAGAQIADGFDVELELERDELARLLDRALALLPPQTRAVLIEHHLLERPRAEIARRLGVSDAAVGMRLQRGKLALRRLLATTMRDEAAAYGLVPSAGAAGQATRIWCPLCGQRRLLGDFAAVDPGGDVRRLVLRCPDCFGNPGDALTTTGGAAVFGGVQGHRAALLRAIRWSRDRLVDLPARRRIGCSRCNAPVATEVRGGGDGPPALRRVHRVFESCAACGQTNDVWLAGLAVATPDGRRFWRDHPRSVVLPEHRVEACGAPAIVTGLRAAGGAPRLEVVLSLAPLRVLGTHRS